MYRQGDKEKITAKLAAESREHRGVCREGETQPARQGKALQPDIACCNPNSSKTRRNDGITSASGSPVVLTGVAIAWEKLVLSDAFSKSEALRTGFELPMLLMQIEVIAGAAGMQLNPRKEGKGKCSSKFTSLWLFTALSEATCSVYKLCDPLSEFSLQLKLEIFLSHLADLLGRRQNHILFNTCW